MCRLAARVSRSVIAQVITYSALAAIVGARVCTAQVIAQSKWSYASWVRQRVTPPEHPALTLRGDAVAYALNRALEKTLRRYGGAQILNDVWFAAAPKWQPTRIVSQGDEGMLFSGLRWSPDGESLAFLATHGLRSVLEVWNRRTHRIVVTSACVIRARAAYPPETWAPIWIDRHHVSLWIRAARCRPEDGHIWSEEYQGIADAEAAWRRWENGRSATYDVLQSGVEQDPERFPLAEIIVLDTWTGKISCIARGVFDQVLPSPDRHMLAILVARKFVTPSENVRWRHLWTHFLSDVLLLPVLHPADSAVVSTNGSAMWRSLRWSPDGERLAFIDYDPNTNAPPCAVAYSWRLSRRTVNYCGSIGDGSAVPNDQWALDHPAQHSIAWTGTGDLAVRLQSRTSQRDRSDWVLVHDSTPAINLTGCLQSVPAELYADSGRTFALADGRLIVLEVLAGGGSVAGCRPVEGDVPANMGVDTVVATQPELALRVAVRGANAGHSAYIRVARGRQTVQLLELPKALRQGSVAAESFDVKQLRALVAVLNDSDGTQRFAVWTASDGYHLLAKVAQHLAHVLEHTIVYRSQRGEILGARVTLPVGYDSTKRYPTIVEVYPGILIPAVHATRVVVASPYSVEGFAVLTPSMPYDYSLDSGSVEPFSTLTNGVLPAIDEAVNEGLIDSARVGILGHSFGGFAVYGLIAQTTRFRAAVALNGMSDFISAYGSMYPPERYAANPLTVSYEMSYFESGQVGLGSPPWDAVDAYVRNSPFFHIATIHTPLLIAQGDMDVTPISQGEQMFNALFRLGRRVDLVRYWGEGHNIGGSYFNAVDFESRVVSWFREFLSVPDSTDKHRVDAEH